MGVVMLKLILMMLLIYVMYSIFSGGISVTVNGQKYELEVQTAHIKTLKK